MALTIKDINRLRREITVVQKLPHSMWLRAFRLADIPVEIGRACIRTRNVRPALAWLDEREINIRAAANVNFERKFGDELARVLQSQ